MAQLLKGADVSAAIVERTKEQVAHLAQQGITPCLAILRVGAKDSDESYVRGAKKRCAETGVKVAEVNLAEDVSQEEFDKALSALNKNNDVHGILMLRPLPKQLDEARACAMLNPAKDVDGCTEGSLAGVFTGSKTGFAPCTAQAVIEILNHYGIDCKGKKAVVIGRSLVIGKPVAMMLLEKNATVEICHSRTSDVASEAREADIIVAATGVMENVDAAYVRAGQTVIDVGISWNNEKGKLCGDVLFEEVEPVVDAITPVPGGVGAVTNAVLISHVVEAALRAH